MQWLRKAKQALAALVKNPFQLISVLGLAFCLAE